jgi:outer membrane protein, heavy metal efflux system
LAIIRNSSLRLVILALFCGRVSAQSAGGDWSVEQCVQIALSRHQAIQAAITHLGGMDGLRTQAASRPNPEIVFQTENWRFNGTPGFRPANDLDIYAYVSQPLERGGKRAVRVDSANHETKIADMERQVLEWRVRQAVRRAYIQALLAQKQLDLLHENTRYYEQLVDYHKVRFEQGATAEADLIKVRLEQERFALGETSAQIETEKAKVELLRAMGMSGSLPSFRLADLDAPLPGEKAASYADLVARAKSKRADLRLEDALIERARLHSAAQRALGKPDWNVIVGYKRTSGYDTLLAGLAVPLPIFNRNRGNIQYSDSEIERAQHSLGAAQVQVEAEINSALAGLRRRFSMLKEMQQGLLDRAEESWRISLAAYREGGTDLLRLLDAQRIRSEVQSLYARTQMEFRLNLVELESAVGEENLSLSEELLRVQ